MAEKKRVAIVGAGASGLAACKHTAERGFFPVVFESAAGVGGLWAHTLDSTKLQSPTADFEFVDFPWAAATSAVDVFPRHDKVLGYLESYARHFDLLGWIRFGSTVIAVEYAGGALEEEMAAWELWSGNGEAFGGSFSGEWRITVQSVADGSTEIYQADFLILCIGRFSGAPKVPSFPEGGGPEMFRGQVIHSMDLSNLDKVSSIELIRGKRVAVIGSGKTTFEVASECADANGVQLPCTMICRTKRWFIDEAGAMRMTFFGYLYRTRFAELLVPKPGTGILSSLLATLLCPLRWVFSKYVERYHMRNMPLKKHGMVPEHSFFEAVSSCLIALLPDKFYEKVEEGSIILKRPNSFSFCKDGLILDGETVESDLVIFATGFNGDQKLRDIFKSVWFQNIVAGTARTTVPLYRECIHPRIPQLAIIGYSDSLSNLHASDMRSKWVSHFLDGGFSLPSIRNMEKNVLEWERYMKRYNGKYFRGSCIGSINIWYNDLLCKDMGYNPRRKKGFLAECFLPYSPSDYADLCTKRK